MLLASARVKLTSGAAHFLLTSFVDQQEKRCIEIDISQALSRFATP